MSGVEIVEYAEREGYRVVVTEQMVVDAIAAASGPFTCGDLAALMPRDASGCAPSEYLVALWVAVLLRDGRVAVVRQMPMTYEAR